MVEEQTEKVAKLRAETEVLKLQAEKERKEINRYRCAYLLTARSTSRLSSEGLCSKRKVAVLDLPCGVRYLKSLRHKHLQHLSMHQVGDPIFPAARRIPEPAIQFVVCHWLQQSLRPQAKLVLGPHN